MRFLKGRDLTVDFLFLIALCFGLYSIFSISVDYFKLQLVFALVSVFIYILLGIVNKELIRVSLFTGYLVMLILLVYLYIFGDPVRGSSSWVKIGNLALQPSEFIKISIIYGASLILSAKKLNLTKKLLILAILFVPAFLLTVFQPDLGTAFSLLVGVASVVFISTISKKQFLYVILLGILAISVSFSFLQDYQKTRIQSFFNPNSDPLGSGYNVIQSEIAVGSGGVFGKGFKKNTQVTFQYLPESHTDFIFAAVSESFGMAYSFSLILILFGMSYRILKKHVAGGSNIFNSYFAMGVFSLLLLHSVLNIGMNLGLLPITGLPLPFVSYGGSSLLTFSIFLGLLQRFNSDP